jgi:hypothetical protein
MASSRLQAPEFLVQDSKMTVSDSFTKFEQKKCVWRAKSFWPATAPAVLPPSEREKSSWNRKNNGRLSTVMVAVAEDPKVNCQDLLIVLICSDMSDTQASNRGHSPVL